MVIRMRHTRSHTANRRSHHGLKTPVMAVCKNCGAMHRPHHMCLNCGFYKSRVVIDLLAKKQEREARMAAKAAARSGEEADMEAVTNPEETTPEAETK